MDRPTPPSNGDPPGNPPGDAAGAVAGMPDSPDRSDKPAEPERAAKPAVPAKPLVAIWRTRTWALVIVGALLPVGLLAAVSYRLARQSVAGMVRSNNQSSAVLAAEMVRRDFVHTSVLADAVARAPGLVQAVERRDEEAARTRLRNIVDVAPEVERAFLTDPDGTEWSDYPKAPESLGKNFAGRDWYRGAHGTVQPYVSEAYRRNTNPQHLVVGVAVAVRDAGGREIGILVFQCPLRALSKMLEPVVVGAGGYVYVVDHTGTVVAHPKLNVEDLEHDELAGLAPIKRAMGRERVTEEYDDPLAGGRRMTAEFVPTRVGDHGWVVVAQQPAAEAFAPLRRLAWGIALAGLALAAAAVPMVVVLGRISDRDRRLSRKLESRAELLEQLASDLEDTAAAERTARVEAEEAHAALRKAQGQLVQSEKLAALGQLVAGVAHEINNPLAFVTNNVVVLQRDMEEVVNLLKLYQAADPCLAEREPALMAEVRDLADRIDLAYTLENVPAVLARSREGLKRIQQIVKDLRDFARQEAVGDRQEGADLNPGVESTLNIARGRAKKQKVELTAELNPLPGVTCSPAKINQVVLNLVMNAIDACKENGTVTIRTRPAGGDWVAVEVADTGSGIPPEVMERIFDPFFTTKPQGQGTGLGLSISHGIVADHGGRIDVRSEVGKGTTFTVFLPVTPPAGSRPRGVSAAQQVNVGGNGGAVAS